MKKGQRASTLVEILVALMVIMVVLTSIMAVMSMSIRLSESNEKRLLALQKAEETVEYFKRERLLNPWSVFFPALPEGSYCFPVASMPDSLQLVASGEYFGTCGPEDTFESAGYEFQREVEISHPDSSTLLLTVVISWMQANGEKTLSLQQEYKEY
jgi:type II secretory pathway pseudopilin PulG